MDSLEIQATLFKQIRISLPAHIAMPEKLSELLGISIDSVYRRIRGEKELSFDEMCILCESFQISMDQLLNLSEGMVLFQGRFLQSGVFSFEDYLKEMLDKLRQINSFEKKQLIYQNKDISIFFYLLFPDLIAFKYYVWLKTHFQFPELNKIGFSFDLLTSEHRLLIKQINKEFMSIPSVEIMNPDNILTDLRQIEYCKATKIFQGEEVLQRLYKSVEDMISHMEMQAQIGKKFIPGELPDVNACSHTLYVHDFHFGDNETLAILDDQKVTVLTHSAINFISTFDTEMGEYSWAFIQNIIRKSTLISATGEKSRTRFFNLIRERIIAFKTNTVKSLFQ